MVGVGRTLRVSIVNVQVEVRHPTFTLSMQTYSTLILQEAKRYHVSLHVLGPGQSPAESADSSKPGQVSNFILIPKETHSTTMTIVFLIRW